MAVGKKMKGALTIRHETVGDKVEYFATGSWRRVVRVALPSNCIDVMLRLLIICGARLTKSTKKGKRVLDVSHVDVLESWFGAEVGTRLRIVIVLYCSNPSCTTYCSATRRWSTRCTATC